MRKDSSFFLDDWQNMASRFVIRLSTCKHPYRDYRYAHKDWCSSVLEAAYGRSRSSVLLVMSAVTFLPCLNFYTHRSTVDGGLTFSIIVIIRTVSTRLICCCPHLYSSRRNYLLYGLPNLPGTWESKLQLKSGSKSSTTHLSKRLLPNNSTRQELCEPPLTGLVSVQETRKAPTLHPPA